jgi:hypothetical protein
MKIDAAEVIESVALIPAGTSPLMKPGIIARLGDERRAVLAAIKSDDACITNPSPKTLAWVFGSENRRDRRSKRWCTITGNEGQK